MPFLYRQTLGYTEVVIAEAGGLNMFYHIADILAGDFGVRYLSREDNFDTIRWDFRFRKQVLALRYDIYNGITMAPAEPGNLSRKLTKAVADLASMLESKIFSSSIRNIA